MRFWNDDIGPDEPHLLDAHGPRDLTPDPGNALRAAGFGDADFDISTDGTFVVTTWQLSRARTHATIGADADRR